MKHIDRLEYNEAGPVMGVVVKAVDPHGRKKFREIIYYQDYNNTLRFVRRPFTLSDHVRVLSDLSTVGKYTR